jgi:ectoine hydroxylase-related dioxygenase (phytanoyl-CoA dioxygenase family)
MAALPDDVVAALAAAFERDGVCVIPDALSPGALLALQTAFVAGLVDSGARAGFEAADQQNEKGQRILGLPNELLLQGDDCFMQLVEHPGLISVLRKLVGEDVQLQEIFSRCYCPEPAGAESMGYVQWHHDHPTPGCFRWVKVQVLLSDVGTDGGALAVVPGSHLRGDPGRGKAGTAQVFEGYKSTRTADGWRPESDMPGMVKLAHKAGTIQIFDTHTWVSERLQNTPPRKTTHCIYLYGGFSQGGLLETLTIAHRHRQYLWGGAPQHLHLLHAVLGTPDPSCTAQCARPGCSGARAHTPAAAAAGPAR